MEKPIEELKRRLKERLGRRVGPESSGAVGIDVGDEKVEFFKLILKPGHFAGSKIIEPRVRFVGENLNALETDFSDALHRPF